MATVYSTLPLGPRSHERWPTQKWHLWKYFLMITMALPKNNETKPSVITANAAIFSVPMHSCGECPLFNSPRWYLHNMQ